MAPPTAKHNRRGSLKGLTDSIETDPGHHLASPFMPQTPLDTRPRSETPSSNGRPTRPSGATPRHVLTRWIVDPSSSFKLLLLPVILYLNWEILAPYVARGLPNPFGHVFLLSNPVSSSKPGDQRYAKSYYDLLFLSYYTVFWSFMRSTIMIHICRPIAKYFGLKKEAKLLRFGEQGYAFIYFAIMGAWGVWIMSDLPTWWYRTEYFYIDYPHWDMKPQFKSYYLIQSAYWIQQLLVLVLRLEKPRKDYAELIAHHIVSLWMVGWSYLINLTYIGNAIFVSMDIPDTLLAFSKLLNYIQWERAKVVSFLIFLCSWTYFRHWLNLVILYRGWYEFDLAPEYTKQWNPAEGVWLPRWLKFQVHFAIACLQAIQLFWYYLMLRILARTIAGKSVRDDRSDDEEDEGEDQVRSKNE